MSASDLPGATTRIDETSGAVGAGTQYCAVLACVATLADGTPRVYANPSSIYENHGYAPGVDYSALHFKKTGLPIIFVPIPIVTQGAIVRMDQSGNSGTSPVSASVGPNGALDELDIVVDVVKGGTVGTDQLTIDLSLDGGRTFRKNLKIGTATSYEIPYVKVTLAFGAGTLVAGDRVLECHTSAPMWDAAGITLAKTKLAAQLKQVRSWQVIGDLVTSTQANMVVDAVEAYETEDERYVQAKCSLRDRFVTSMSQARVHMTGSPQITFAEVGATGDTITRDVGSFVADGFQVGDTVRVTGAIASAGANNITGVVTNVTALVLTLDTADLVNEGPIAGVAITSEPTLTFAEVGATGDTITRNRGSWVVEGFKIGDKLTIDGTASNDFVGASAITNVTATVLTLGADDLTAEVIGMIGVSITAGETKAQHVQELDDEMEDITSYRIELGYGRGRILSPFLSAFMRRSSSWHDNLRAYAKDIHVATWKVANGALDGVDLKGVDTTIDEPYEHDERIDGGALAAGFTCLRTHGDRGGVYVAKSITRGTGPLRLAQNMSVVNLAQMIAQTEATTAIGEDLDLNSDNTATGESLTTIAQRVNSAERRELLADKKGQGKRASAVTWTPRSDDDLSGEDATLNAGLELRLKGKLVHINTRIRVNAGA